jgi:repressor LexA
MNALTPIQCKVLDFIIQEVREHSLPPTHREISAAFAWRSNAAAKCHLLALEKKGFIRTRTRISRGIEIKPTAHDWVRGRAARAELEA